MKNQTITNKLILFILFCVLSLYGTQALADPGDVGDVSIDGWCDDGGKDIGDGYCHPCGRPGEYCCDGEYCYDQSAGYQCTGWPNGRCYNQDSDPAYCGHVGRPICEGQDTCYSGEPLYGYCQACGDLTQPCCTNTSYPCDYGTCNVDGICWSGSGSNSSSSGDSSKGGCLLRTLF